MKSLKIALVGNPNCGKTTLFNAYTGLDVKVANWPGVTVDMTCGTAKVNGITYTICDLPGTYSLHTYSKEEEITKKHLLSGDTDVIINVLDASNLERNLFLSLELAELGKPVVLALNMIDIAKKQGIVIDVKKLGRILGVTVVEISAKKKTGIYELIKATENAKCPVPSAVASEKERYSLIENILKTVLVCPDKKQNLSQRADRILTHRLFGMPIFFGIMGLVFFLTFIVGDYIKILFENWLESFIFGVEKFLFHHNIHRMLISLITDGVIAGVGGILTFLPNIFILFLSLAILEDSGYMSRVCYIMDNVMSKLGLSGRAFIPMILGFGCTVPAVLSARTLKSRKEQVKTVLAIPFMSCSAKLPVYVMLSKLFFGKYAALCAYSMYVIGFFAAIVFLFISSIKEERESGLLIELPDYRLPGVRTVFIYVWDKIKDYLLKAGTTIFLASVILWLVLHLGKNGITDNVAESFGAKLGKAFVPVMKTAGLGQWQTIVSLIMGIAAKEAVVSGFSVLFGVTNISSISGMDELYYKLSQAGFDGLSAYSMMLFCLLYTPCIASIITVRREIKSAKITYIAILVQLIVAWTISTAFYQVGRMIF